MKTRKRSWLTKGFILLLVLITLIELVLLCQEFQHMGIIFLAFVIFTQINKVIMEATELYIIKDEELPFSEEDYKKSIIISIFAIIFLIVSGIEAFFGYKLLYYIEGIEYVLFFIAFAINSIIISSILHMDWKTKKEEKVKKQKLIKEALNAIDKEK